jgi:predicted metal-dependent hydrolase
LVTGGAGDLRQVILDGRQIDYRLCRRRRRSIGLTVNADGLRVAAPLRASLTEIHTVLGRHAAWVVDKLRCLEARAQRPVPRFTHGSTLQVLGVEHTLSIHAPGAPGIAWRDGCLCLNATPDQALGPLILGALRTRAASHFAARLAFFAAQWACPAPPFALSNARTRWGSCSPGGRLRLNWRLIHFAPDVIDYVVVHELAHLRQLNHSPRFWAEVENLCPDYKGRRKALKLAAELLPPYDFFI